MHTSSKQAVLGCNFLGKEKVLEFPLKSIQGDINKFYYDLKDRFGLKTPTYFDNKHLKLMDGGRADAKPISDYHWEMYRTKYGMLVIDYWYQHDNCSGSYKALHFYEYGKSDQLYKMKIAFILDSDEPSILTEIEVLMNEITGNK